MTKFNVPLGQWFGIPVYLHWTWVLLFLFILYSDPSFALIYAGLFGLVLLHELGHSLAARYFDAPTKDITLWPFGGIANIQIPFEPKQEFFVAIAGPAVNFFLFPVFWGLSHYSNFCTQLGYYNIALLVFNLIPAFPMDGGRVFRSLLSLMIRNHLKATLIAVRVGQAICVVFGILGAVNGAFMLVVIGVFIAMAAEGELSVARTCELAREFTGKQAYTHWEAMKAIELRLLEMEREREERQIG